MLLLIGVVARGAKLSDGRRALGVDGDRGRGDVLGFGVGGGFAGEEGAVEGVEGGEFGGEADGELGRGLAGYVEVGVDGEREEDKGVAFTGHFECEVGCV